MVDKIDGRTREARIAKQRRRRTDNLDEAHFNLAVHGERDPAYEYRWINDDEKGRLARKTVGDDWDVVTDREGVAKEDADSLGSEVSVIVGAKKDMSPMRTVLCRKLKEFCDEDRARKAARLDAVDDQIRHGAIQHPEGANGPHFYTATERNPSGRNRVE